MIDWSDASMAPTRAVMQMSKEEHSPMVRQDNHGAEVDIWGIGYYLKSLAYRSQTLNPIAVRKMADNWMANQAMTAEAALKEINVCIRHLLVMFTDISP